MYAKHLDTLSGRTKQADWMSPRHDRKTTSYSATTYLIHPRQVSRKDGVWMLLRAIVKIGTLIEQLAYNPGLEKARARDYSISK